MLDSADRQVQPEPFTREALARLPLAEAVLLLWSHVLQPDRLAKIFDQNRGRGFEDVLSFPTFVELIADALVQHRGSGRQSLLQAQERGTLPTTPRAVYGKLARASKSLSLGFLEETTAAMEALWPAGAKAAAEPASLDGLTVVNLDGKKIKRAAKRLKPLRGTPGKVFGGKLLAAHLPSSGLVAAMAADPDGEANDIKLVPEALRRARARIPGPRLWVADRQFCDLDQPRRFSEEGDHFLIRFSRKTGFHPDSERPSIASRDRRGWIIIEEWGWIGAADDERRRWVRRITLRRPDAEDVIVITDLTDSDAHPAADLLDVYLGRWGIERVFQQITEVFGLERLIGGTPLATIFQASFCLVLYNLIQVVRAYIAAARPEPTLVESLSSEQIFGDARGELTALNKVAPPAEVAAAIPRTMTREEVAHRLGELLGGRWSSLWVKAVNKRPRPAKEKAKGSGAHTSVHKVLQEYRKQSMPPGKTA